MREFFIKYWIEAAMGGIVALIGFGYRRLSARLKTEGIRNQALERGMCALLRDRIIQGYNYYRPQGRWPIYSRDSMRDMYKQYGKLGGNGTIKDLMADLSDLPTENSAGE